MKWSFVEFIHFWIIQRLKQQIPINVTVHGMKYELQNRAKHRRQLTLHGSWLWHLPTPNLSVWAASPTVSESFLPVHTRAQSTHEQLSATLSLCSTSSPKCTTRTETGWQNVLGKSCQKLKISSYGNRPSWIKHTVRDEIHRHGKVRTIVRRSKNAWIPEPLFVLPYCTPPQFAYLQLNTWQILC